MAEFQQIDSDFSPLEWEEDVLQFWREEDIFRRTLEQDSPEGDYIFFEGPPTANNVPHIGHVLTRVIKDLFPRYRTMRGYRVRRKAGWDTHGLPVEIEIEKELGIEDKNEVEDIVEGDPEASIAQFNEKCRESVLRYEKSWREVTERIGFWLDLDDAYFTFTNDYVESVWWILSEMFDEGLLYQGHKILPYCPLCGTTHSSHEVAQNFQEDVPDPSIYAKFAVEDGEELHTEDVPTYLLVWTTTPWTLLSNVSVAVHPEVDYVKVELTPEKNEVERTEHLVLAEKLLESAGLEDNEIVERYSGDELGGVRYEPLFPEIAEALLEDEESYTLGTRDQRKPNLDDGWDIVVDDYVTIEEGSGLVHQAPAFGEDDYRVGRKENIPFVTAITGEGQVKDAVAEAFNREVEKAVDAGLFDARFADEYTLKGKYVKDFGVGEDNTADPYIFNFLKFTGRTLDVEGKSGLNAYTHNYPFCWRHDTPLIYYAADSWFIRTTELKQELIEANREINWLPEHIQEGRMGDWLENVVDWALSRDRYWGTPLPVWENSRTGETVCIGSYQELFEKAGREDEYEELKQSGRLYDAEAEGGFNPHRPFIDGFTWEDGEGGTWERVDEVIDAWFDSGSMPYAQVHYPFEKDEFPLEQYYPADFISEAIDQTRGWFFTLHVISVFLSSRVEEVREDAGVDSDPAYNNCIVLGHILDEEGRKMSKSLGNVVEPNEILDQVGADAMRWYLYSATQPWTPTRFSERLLRESSQKLLLPIYNALSFFTIYANIDGFDPEGSPEVPLAERTELDRWIAIRLDRLTGDLIEHLDNYRIVEACEALEEFVDQLTNWYIRRNRDRFWQSEKDQSKWAAYRTLHEVLKRVSKLIAPFVPFFAEYLHGVVAEPFGGEDSVHLEDYPEPRHIERELEGGEDLVEGMDAVLRVAELGRAVRASNQLKIRQPLKRVVLVTRDEELREVLEPYTEIIRDELNIKRVEWAEKAEDFVTYEIKPDFSVLGERLGGKVKDLAAELGQLSTEQAQEVHETVTAGGTVEFELDGETVELEAGDLDIRLNEREGTVSQADKDLLLVLDTEITEELKREGIAREFVNRVQNIRKDLDLDYVQRIALTVDAPDPVGGAVEEHAGLIKSETLATSLERGAVADGHTSEIEGEEVSIGLTTVSKQEA